MSSLRLCLLCIAPLATLPAAGAAPVLPPHTAGTALARVDIHGDPLPPGAVGRLGRVDRSRHGSSIRCLAATPDRRLLATGSADASICVWDAATGKELRTWTGHRGAILALAFSPDGKTLASASADQYIRLWDVATGNQTLQLVGFTTSFALAFAPDGKTLATGGKGQTRTLRLWELSAGTELEPIFHHYKPVKALAFTADGQYLLTGGQDAAVRTWSLKTRKDERKLEGAFQEVTALTVAPDGKTVAGAGHDGKVYLWETDSGKLTRQWPAHPGNVEGLAFSGDGKLLASSGAGLESVRLWDVATGDAREQFMLTRVSGVAFGMGGKMVFAGSHAGLLGRWELAAGDPGKQPPPPRPGPIHALFFAKDGGQVTTVTGLHLRRWDPAAMKELATTAAAAGESRAVATAPQAGLAAVAYFNVNEDVNFSRVRVVAADQGKEVRSWTNSTPPRTIAQLCLAADGKTVAALSVNDVALWDAATGNQLARFPAEQLKRKDGSSWGPGGGRIFQAIALSATGRWFAATPTAGPIHVWDVKAGFTPLRLGFDSDRFQSLAFAPDGRTLASLTHAGLVQFWDLHVGGERLRLPPLPVVGLVDNVNAPDSSPPEEPRLPLLFSPDSRWFAAAGTDRTIRVWDAATGAEIARFAGHRDDVLALAWRADGLVLASGSRDATALLWDLRPSLTRDLAAAFPIRQECWQELGSVDAGKGHRAVWALAARPKMTLTFLSKLLQPQAKAGKTVVSLIEELDSPRFPVRNQAAAELKKRGAAALPAVREALTKSLSLEARRRLEKMVQDLEGQPPNADEVRLSRAVEVLERIGTPEARDLLARLARGAEDGRLTIEARAALERFGWRPTVATP